MGTVDSSPDKEFEAVQDSQISEFDSPLVPTSARNVFRDDDDDDDDDDKVRPNFIVDTENDSLNSDDDLSDLDGGLLLPCDKPKLSDDVDPILKRSMLSKRKAPSNDEDEDISRTPKKSVNYIPLKNYNLGKSFDTTIITKIIKLQDLNDEISKSPRKSTSLVVTSNTVAKRELQKSLKFSGTVPEIYLDLVTKETISDKYKDWYFISENCHYEELTDLEMKDMDHSFLFDNGVFQGNVPEFMRSKCPNIANLLVLFGISEKKSQSLKIQYKENENCKYDKLCTIFPTEKMLKFLMYYYKGDGEEREVFLKSFICLILDKNVFNSMEFEFRLCYKILKLFDETHFINSYLEIVCKDDFFLHYRLLQIFPILQNVLLRKLFNEEEATSDTTRQNLIDKFNELFDYKKYKNLLYFILMMYGSKFIPFGPKSQVTEYFRDCILDVSNETTNDVEISILKGILNLFSKIR
ncbi:Smc5-Smc6 complex subunit KRE29 [Saccharomyces eubayanus]|uniref:Smc5-Smc6 complex subunit KRE29 n=1 Tax=Saccharomyces eubayanus TaxID=1080349 RepID=UPI0006C70ECC|nr:KRE29-like protein [Saccharomyces eubayanus]KOG99985.1 KRE29-like protein [Saccharomyces eubayanus]